MGNIEPERDHRSVSSKQSGELTSSMRKSVAEQDEDRPVDSVTSRAESGPKILASSSFLDQLLLFAAGGDLTCIAKGRPNVL